MRENTADKSPSGLDHSGSIYANLVEDINSSSTWDLMSTLSRPDLISLTSGFPATETFGEEAFQEICGTVASQGARALKYGPIASLESV